MEYPADLNSTITANAVQQKVAGILHSPVCDTNVVSTVPQVVGPCVCRDFRSENTSNSTRIFRHIDDPLRQKSLIPKSGLLAKALVGPNQYRLDVIFGGRGDQKPRHRVTYHWSDGPRLAQRGDRFVR